MKNVLYEKVKDVNANTFYGQFGEDALIQTYFKNKSWNETREIVIKKEGFYVDIGSYSPSALSNTFWFYQNGWRGITVDATPGVKESFIKFRPKDINVHAAIANKEGNLKLYSWGNSVFNTLSQVEVNNLLRENKVTEKPEEVWVPTMKLSSLLEMYLPKNQSIDFINIDVEGNDFEVLQSNDWNKYRPELIIIESNSSRIEDLINEDIYQFLQLKNYQLIYWVQPSLIFKNLGTD